MKAGPASGPTMRFGLRVDFRNPAIAGTTMADRYAAALDMAEWADRLGCTSITVSEHHGAPDGYLPSPIPILAAMAARTTDVRFLIAALIAPFHDPLRLAEDMIVVDILSRGRVDLIVAGGYVHEEFALFDVPMSERGKRVTEMVSTLKAAFRGEAFEYRGRGSSRRCRRSGSSTGTRCRSSAAPIPVRVRSARTGSSRSPGNPTRAGRRWRRSSSMRRTRTACGRPRTTLPRRSTSAADADQLRAMGQYRVLTPEQLVAELKAVPLPFALFHPLCGGMPPELAWSSLRLFEHEVLPALT